MFIWANYKESKRKGKLIRLQSKIETLEGNIQIDDPSNKSGLDTSHTTNIQHLTLIPKLMFITMIHLYKMDFTREKTLNS